MLLRRGVSRSSASVVVLRGSYINAFNRSTIVPKRFKGSSDAPSPPYDLKEALTAPLPTKSSRLQLPCSTPEAIQLKTGFTLVYLLQHCPSSKEEEVHGLPLVYGSFFGFAITCGLIAYWFGSAFVEWMEGSYGKDDDD